MGRPKLRDPVLQEQAPQPKSLPLPRPRQVRLYGVSLRFQQLPHQYQVQYHSHRHSIDGDSPRNDGGEGEEVNAAHDTIHGASPAISLWLSRQEQARSPSMHGTDRQPEVGANLEDRRGSPQRRPQDQPATGERHNPEDPVESERQRPSNEAWEESQKANESVRATQRHLRAITDETQVATTNLENINRKLELMRREEEIITRLRLEREKREYEEQRAERMR